MARLFVGRVRAARGLRSALSGAGRHVYRFHKRRVHAAWAPDGRELFYVSDDGPLIVVGVTLGTSCGGRRWPYGPWRFLISIDSRLCLDRVSSSNTLGPRTRVRRDGVVAPRAPLTCPVFSPR